jgi:peptide/nickel transport system substrate-binding protein
VIFSYTRAVTLNKSPAFILNVLGWDASNIASQLKKVDDHTLQLHWTADVSPSVALNISPRRLPPSSMKSRSRQT